MTFDFAKLRIRIPLSGQCKNNSFDYRHELSSKTLKIALGIIRGGWGCSDRWGHSDNSCSNFRNRRD